MWNFFGLLPVCLGLGHDTQRLTGNGSAPSWMTKPSIRWVRMWDLTIAWAALLSPLCWLPPPPLLLLLLLLLLPFPFPEVMTGAMAATPLSTVNTSDKHTANSTTGPLEPSRPPRLLPDSCSSNTQSMQQGNSAFQNVLVLI